MLNQRLLASPCDVDVIFVMINSSIFLKVLVDHIGVCADTNKHYFSDFMLMSSQSVCIQCNYFQLQFLSPVLLHTRVKSLCNCGLSNTHKHVTITNILFTILHGNHCIGNVKIFYMFFVIPCKL